MMLLSGQSGSTEHTLKSFLSVFSKRSQMSILLDGQSYSKNHHKFLFEWQISMKMFFTIPLLLLLLLWSTVVIQDFQVWGGASIPGP